MGHMGVTRLRDRVRSGSAESRKLPARAVPFAVGAAVGVAAGTVAGVLLGQEIGRAVSGLISAVDRRSAPNEEPRFDLLLQ